MTSCFIRPGYIHKKLLIPLILTIITLVQYITTDKNIVGNWPNNDLINTISSAVGYTLIIIVPHIKIFSNKNIQFKTGKKYSCKRHILHYFILFLCYLFYILIIMLKLIIKFGGLKSNNEGNKDNSSFHTRGFCTAESLEMIFLTIFTHIIFKDRYYRHHILSLIIFVISSVLIDITIQSEEDLEYFYLIMLQVLFDSIYLIYQKYMIDKLYYSPYHVGCGIGVSLLYITIMSSIFSENDIEGFIENNNILLVILSVLINVVLNFIINLLKMFTIAYFGCNFILATYVFSKLFILLMSKGLGNEETKYYSLIPGVFQFLSMLIYLEIFELNFLNINKYSKKNIEARASLDSKDTGEDENYYEEIEPGYLFHREENDGNNSTKSSDLLELNIMI